MTHASGADHRLSSNERLEFLGDAILGLVVCEQLYLQFPGQLEGDLTKLKSIVVSRQTCAKISQALGLREFLVLGKGMTTNPAVPPSVLSDVLESLIAAVYLDGGIVPAREFVLMYFGPEIESAAAGDSGGNYKSLLQQFSQREHGVTPTYHLQEEKGPDHSKCFKMSAQIGRERYCASLGAEQKGKRTASRAQRNLRTARRSGALPWRQYRRKRRNFRRLTTGSNFAVNSPRATSRRKLGFRRCDQFHRLGDDAPRLASQTPLLVRA